MERDAKVIFLGYLWHAGGLPQRCAGRAARLGRAAGDDNGKSPSGNPRTGNGSQTHPSPEHLPGEGNPRGRGGGRGVSYNPGPLVSPVPPS